MPAPRRAAAAIELVEDALLLAGGRPGPAVGDLDDDLPAALPSAPISIGVPGGVCLAAFSSRLTNTCSSSTASIGTSGRSGGKSRRDGSVPRAAPPAAAARRRPRRAGAATPSAPASAPVSTRIMSSRFATSRSCAATPATIVSTSSRRAPASLGPVVLQQRARRALDRGQRRAHVVRERAQQRRPEPLRLDLDLGRRLRSASASARARPPSGRRATRAGGAGRDRGSSAAPQGGCRGPRPCAPMTASGT